ncbi:MAG: polysaccharide biosynthesis phosphomannomutase UppO [Rhizobiaceae bacterium]
MSQEELKFGTSGLRGLASILNGKPAAAFARAFTTVMIDQGRLKKGGEVLLGRDLRSSSESIVNYCMAGICSAGAHAIDCGLLPTPALAAYAIKVNAPAIMVTGSHIPEDRNGLKFYRPDGEIDKHDEIAILAAESSLSASACATTSPNKSSNQPWAHYLARAQSLLEAGALRGMRIGVYQHSSVLREMLVEVLEAYGAAVFPFGSSDFFVPVDTEAMRIEDCDLCKKKTLELGLDAIVSTDGDADRPLVADEAGNFVRGDLIGAVTASALGAKCVVTPITSNSGIEKCGQFNDILRTRVGSPYVIEGMRSFSSGASGGIVGFEANGGVLLGTDAALGNRHVTALPTRDAMLPILAVLWASKSSGRSISSLADNFRFSAAYADRLQGVSSEKSRKLLHSLTTDADFRDHFLSGLITASSLDTTDGVQLKSADGEILHYRASGNAPELRCYVEAKSPSAAKFLLKQGLSKAQAQVA